MIELIFGQSVLIDYVLIVCLCECVADNIAVTLKIQECTGISLGL